MITLSTSVIWTTKMTRTPELKTMVNLRLGMLPNSEWLNFGRLTGGTRRTLVAPPWTQFCVPDFSYDEIQAC